MMRSGIAVTVCLAGAIGVWVAATFVHGSGEPNRLSFRGAVVLGNVELVRQYVREGQAGDGAVEAKDAFLTLAVHEGHIDVARVLLAEGKSNPNVADDQGRTPLWEACRPFHIDLRCAAVLLEHGADANLQDKNGYTLLQELSRRLHDDHESGEVEEAIRFLVARGANLNKRGWLGRTILFSVIDETVPYYGPRTVSWAVSFKKSLAKRGEDLVKLLLESGADASIGDDEGCTPLHRAAASWHGARMVELLLAVGARVDARDKKGRTPLELLDSCVNDPHDDCDLAAAKQNYHYDQKRVLLRAH